MKRILFIFMLLSFPVVLSAQADRREVRAGNRKFARGDFRESEIDYRKALLKDSTSFAAAYNLASSLYKEENYEEAGKALDTVKEMVPGSGHDSEWYFNAGDVALGKKDYASAVKAFRESLLLNPGDLQAKENYIYAKLMLQNQQQQQQQQQQNQDQNQQDQNQQDQNQQDQNQDQQDQNQQNQNQQNQGQDQDQPEPENQQQPGQISKQQAQQMLKAVQAQEKNTKDKVDKEKAALLKSKEKEKNW